MPQPQEDDDAMTAVTVATDAPDDFVPPPALHHQEKQGGKFCGFCCDYRRAVLIFGSVTVIMAMLDLVFELAGISTEYEPPFDDDQLNQQLLALNQMYRIPYLLMEAMAVVFGGVSIMGALSFSKLGTCVALIYALASTTVLILIDIDGRKSVNEILQDFGQEIVGAPIFYYCFVVVVAIIFWHPSGCFLWEVHRGIMTRRTYYEREEFSCCCLV